nr:hypothetical protein [Candidatus Dependentiae bacterium]
MTSSAIKFIIFLGIMAVSFYTVFMYNSQLVYPLGLAETNFIDRSRIFDNQPRTLKVLIWYPIKNESRVEKIEYDIWKVKDTTKDAIPRADKKLPLIIFSHGYSGHPYANSWFAEYLASHGYIVASIQHYGNSFPESMIPEISVRPWNRPQDMSFVLDHLLAHPLWGQSIDTDKIGAAGFSQGGIASLWLAGIRADLTQDILKKQITFINDPFLRNLHFKNYSPQRLDAVLSQFTHKDFEEANRSYKDPRIKAVCALAPGIDKENPMFLKEGLSGVKVPVSIVVGENDDVAVSQFFAAHIPQSTLCILPGKVTHWTLLNEATEHGKKINPFITVDDSSIDRAKIHQQVGSL